MGIVRKQSILNTLIYYGGMLLAYVSMVVVVPNVLTLEQYGLVRLFFPFASILTLFFLLGIPNVILRFFPFYKDEKNKNGGLLFFVLSIALVSIIVFTTLFFIFKDAFLSFYVKESPLFVENYIYAIPIAIGIALFEILNAYCRANYKSIFPTFVNEIYVRLMVIFLAILFYFEYINFKIFLSLFSLLYLLNPILLFVFLKTQGILFLSPRKKIFESESLKKLGTYGIFNFFGGATGTLIDKVDVLLVASFLGLAFTGIYGIAIQMAMAVTMPAKALALILNPMVAEAFKNNDHEQLEKLYKSSSRNQFLAGALIMILIWVNFKSFFTIVKPEFLPAMIPFTILGVARVFDMVTGINGMIINISRFFRVDILFGVLLLVLTILNNWLLIPKYQMTGAAAATLIALMIYNIVKYVFVWKKLNLQPFTFDTLKILIFSTSVAIIAYFIPQLDNLFLDIAFKTSIVGILFLIGLYALKLSPEMIEILQSQIDKFKRKKQS